MALTLDRVTLDLRGRRVLADASAAFAAGHHRDHRANGAGKTSLLRAAAGLIAPSAGETIDGAIAAMRREARTIGYLPQSGNVVWNMRRATSSRSAACHTAPVRRRYCRGRGDGSDRHRIRRRRVGGVGRRACARVAGARAWRASRNGCSTSRGEPRPRISSTCSTGWRSGGARRQGRRRAPRPRAGRASQTG